MLDRIKALFAPDGVAPPSPQRDDVAFAAAALLVIAAEQDGLLCGAERDRIASLLAARFGLAAEEVAELVAEAESRVADAAQILPFTRAIKDRFTPEQRVEMVEMLWEVVYADGVLSDHEATLMRRVGGLIYVSDQERGAARQRALRRSGSGAGKA